MYYVQLTVYAYNWAADLENQLKEELKHIIQWHNARSHLLACILGQKMGLFHHLALTYSPIDADAGVLTNMIPVFVINYLEF